MNFIGGSFLLFIFHCWFWLKIDPATDSLEKIQRHSKSGNNLSKLCSCGLNKGTAYFHFT